MNWKTIQERVNTSSVPARDFNLEAVFNATENVHLYMLGGAFMQGKVVGVGKDFVVIERAGNAGQTFDRIIPFASILWVEP